MDETSWKTSIWLQGWRLHGLVGMGIAAIGAVLYLGGPPRRIPPLEDVKSAALREVLRQTSVLESEGDNSGTYAISGNPETGTWRFDGGFTREQIVPEAERRMITDLRYALSGKVRCAVIEPGCVSIHTSEVLMTRTLGPIY